ncbi:N-glycosylase/DNA lyase [Hypnocyclicus thermotrophus]|uniref:8-oxoguanine DNA glycosylase/AP lyase n=1 Tax=Hypnocyclicus thermotrophus TaxID=1627895 RepID=A0AA46DXM2_9FUSO|nr:N-glycosylase/DNA lyase [Hypnocyclicus thermotrophus]TDT68594.1 N-glycosylase/DNA lyase [Hypnocyclicus thermotrophus]
MDIKELKNSYKRLKIDIEKRLEEFKLIWLEGNNEDIFIELAFCILTPQSKAKSAWKAITKLKETGLLFYGEEEEIVEYLNIVRFKNTKAKNLVLLRETIKDENGVIIIKEILDKLESPIKMRNWIVKNIRGIGYKEASHFLRNIGFGSKLAILDRHILKNLFKLNVINEIPKTLTAKKYLEIENKMIEFSKKINIKMEHLDFVLWYQEAGEIFK